MADKVGGVLARIGTPAGASVAVDVAAVKAIVDIIDGLHDVPTADAVTNAFMRDVLGIKTDAAVEVVSAVNSLMAYIKGLTQELDQRSVAKVAWALDSTNSFTDVLNLSDKGVLTGIFQALQLSDVASGTEQGGIRLTIDGVLKWTEPNFSEKFTTDGSASFASLSFNHRFDTSIQVEAKNSGNTISVWTSVAYTIKA